MQTRRNSTSRMQFYVYKFHCHKLTNVKLLATVGIKFAHINYSPEIIPINNDVVGFGKYFKFYLQASEKMLLGTGKFHQLYMSFNIRY